jgi:ATP-dependent Clp protease ATP-binding subunit ClpC
MYERHTDRARKVLQLANQEAQRFNHEYIGTEHVLLGLVKEGGGVAANVLKNLDIDLRKIRREVEKIVQAGPDMVTMGKLPQTPRTRKALEYAVEEARNLNHNYVGTEHLLLGLLREEEGLAAQVLMNLGLKLEDVRAEVLRLLGHTPPVSDTSGPIELPDRPTVPTPVLDRFGQDLTAPATQRHLDPVLGREDELGQLINILGRRHRPCALLLGTAGAGKTALVHGLAQRLARGDVPEALRGRRLLTLSLGRLAADGRARPALSQALEEARQSKAILFFDDLNLFPNQVRKLVGLLKGDPEPAGLACIGALTPAASARGLLAGCFRGVLVEPLSPAATLDIVKDRRPGLEAFHHVRIADDALAAAVELADRDLTGGLPGKALDVLDEACACVRAALPAPPPQVAALTARIDRIRQEKEQAVDTQNFEYAAQLRMDFDRLKQQHEEVLREWRQRLEASSTVAAAVVAGVVQELRCVEQGANGV